MEYRLFRTESGNEPKIPSSAVAQAKERNRVWPTLRKLELESTITVKDRKHRENSIRVFELEAQPNNDPQGLGSLPHSLSVSLHARSLYLPLSFSVYLFVFLFARFQSNSARNLASPEASATINVLSSICNFVSTMSTAIKRRQTVAAIRAIVSVLGVSNVPQNNLQVFSWHCNQES